MLSVELTNLADMLDQTRQLPNVSQQAKEWSSRTHGAIWNTTVRFTIQPSSRRIFDQSTLQVADNIFAYETNGNLDYPNE